MPPDKLLRRDRPRLVAGIFQRVEMPVFRDDPVRLRRDGAVGEFVVIGIGADEAEAESGRDVQHVAVLLADDFHQRKHFSDTAGAGVFANDFLVFEQDFGRDRPMQTAVELCGEDRAGAVSGMEHPEHDIRINDDGHR